MIIKRKLKSQMPSLKRCKFVESGEDADGGGNNNFSFKRKKRPKESNGYYPFNLLGDVAAGVIPLGFDGILHAKGFGWCGSERSSTPEEGETVKELKAESPRVQMREVVEVVSRPPLVRTSRGRVQVLPSRFNDSVIDNWRKDSKTSSRDCSVDDDLDDDYVECKKQKPVARSSCSNANNVKNSKSKVDRAGCKSRKCATLCKVEEEHEYQVKFDFRDRKYMGSRKGLLVPMHEERGADIDDQKCQPEEKLNLSTEDQFLSVARVDDGLYGPEDFYSGDIVWAKSGKKDIFWPAIVIDPMSQAPELVLRACIPDAACVMFFGYFDDRHHRV